MQIRPATLTDVGEILQVCDQAWKGIWQGSRQMFADRILTFPECGIVVGEIDGRIEGYVSVQLIDQNKLLVPSWDKATDFGHIKMTHNPNGEWIHGVGLAVTPAGCRAGLTGGLVRFLYDYMVDEKKRGCQFVTRMPGYRRFQGRMGPAEYAATLRNDKPIDPELRVLNEYGLRVIEPPVIFEDYVDGGGDPGSCGFSVLIGLLNPFLESNPISPG